MTSTYDLLARVEQGDEYAFTALFEKYQKRLALLIYYKLSREMRRLADAEDVLQETFLEAFRDISVFVMRNQGASSAGCRNRRSRNRRRRPIPWQTEAARRTCAIPVGRNPGRA